MFPYWLKNLFPKKSRPSPARQAPRAKPWQPALEELESRLVPAVKVSILGGVLTAQADNIGVNTVTVDHVVVAGKGFAQINGGKLFADGSYTSIRINGGAGGTVTSVHGNVKPLTVFGASANDVVNLGDAAHKLQGIQGTVLVEDEKGFAGTLNINDQGDTSLHTVTLSTVTRPGDSSLGQLTGLSAPISWDYGDTSAVNLKLGPGASHVNVLGTGTATNIVITAPNAVVNAGNGNVAANIKGTLNLQAPAGGATVTILDNNDSAGPTATLAAVSRVNQSSLGQLSGLGSGVITWDSLGTPQVFVVGGSGTDTFNIQGTVAPTVITANGPAIMNVGSGGSLAGIQSSLFLKNNSGPNNTVTINSQNDSATTDAFLEAEGGDSSTGVGFFFVQGVSSDIFFDKAGTSALTLNLASRTVVVDNTVVPTTIFSQGEATIDVTLTGNNQRAGIQANLTLENDHGRLFKDIINIDDSKDVTGRTYSLASLPGDQPGITFEQLSSDAMPGLITWDNADTRLATVRGGSGGSAGGNVWNIAGTGSETTIDAGAGHDTINVPPIGTPGSLGADIVGILTLNGNVGTTLNLNDLGDGNSETFNFSIPSPGSGTLNLGTTPGFDLVFNNMGTVNLFTNLFSTVNDPSFTVNVFLPPTP
jgi:hypothetical protein